MQKPEIGYEKLPVVIYMHIFLLKLIAVRNKEKQRGRSLEKYASFCDGFETIYIVTKFVTYFSSDAF